MITIQEAVEKELTRHPLHAKLLQKNMLNSTGFAKMIQPAVEKELFKNVSIATIVTSLARAKKYLKIEEAPKINSVSVIYPLVWKSFENLSENQQEDLLEQLPKLHSYYENQNSIVLTHKDVGNVYSFDFKYQTITGICELELDFDQTHQLESGLFYQISRELHWKNITVIDFNTSQNKIWLYILVQDLAEALEIIRTKFIKTKKPKAS
jgi:hypothetical protein